MYYCSICGGERDSRAHTCYDPLSALDATIGRSLPAIRRAPGATNESPSDPDDIGRLWFVKCPDGRRRAVYVDTAHDEALAAWLISRFDWYASYPEGSLKLDNPRRPGWEPPVRRFSTATNSLEVVGS